MAEVGARGGGLFEKRLAELAKRVRNPGTLRVGFLEDATYPDGTSVAMVAATQNFGAPGAGIPARPFFTKLVNERSPEWGARLAKILAANDWDAKAALALLGEGIAGQLRQSIVDMNAPPLSAITLMLRKMKRDNPDLVVTGATVGEAAAKVRAGESADGVSTKPLVETGVLLAAVDYEVTDDG